MLSELILYFKYKKIEESYWNKKYLMNQIINKALLFVKSLYLGYKLLFIFDNIKNFSIYAKNILQVAYRNKRLSNQQLFH